MSANDIQIGGDHYKTEFQPWDLIELNAIGFLEGAAIKYISRWRKKNGVQDLQKAIHYLVKAAEMAYNGQKYNRSEVIDDKEFERYKIANNLSDREDYIIRIICNWTDEKDLDTAAQLIQDIIDHA